MKLAVTGGSGGIGRAVIAAALTRGDHVVSLDRVTPPDTAAVDRFEFRQAEMSDYDKLVAAFAGCDGLIHLAGIPSPFTLPDHVVHNNNVVGSYNAMRAAVECNISRICQASSVNAIGLTYTRHPRFDYFPVDEHHPNYTEEPYGLSKWICEQQADTFARRHDGLSIASMRFHFVVDDWSVAANHESRKAESDIPNHLWGYTLFDAAADACLLSLEAPFRGHEAFYIAAPDTAADAPSLELAARYFPQVPIRGDLSGYRSFFTSKKAEALLGWKHPARLRDDVIRA